ncbi:MAG: IS110 family transposase [Gemmatimonadaceae bacterium]|nr:IS110 family transposase [Gemmatimonadaceae bacterium]MBA3559485.1 IS110 family transposase [Gemmatimonadaceae bacterium]
MPTLTTRPSSETLLLALDLGNKMWKLGFTVGGPGGPPRIRTMPARDLRCLRNEIAVAKKRFRLSDDAPVMSCYEAGRDGFWLHRALTSIGVTSLVVDSASIERNSRARQVKSDRLDTQALLNKLCRHAARERGVWSVINVPSVDDEDRRQLHRELFTIKREHTRAINRIKGLLALYGIGFESRGLPRLMPPQTELRMWNGTSIPNAAYARLVREWSRLTLVRREIKALVNERRALLEADDPTDPTLPMVRKLLALRAVGEVSAWIYTTEFFAWRQFRNRRQVGAAAGLCSTLRSSGDMRREGGISKAGNRFLRALAIELAWSWLRYQPQSALAKWYRDRFGSGGARLRRVGIVALARKLLIALWHYLETGVVPEGAVLKA